MTAKLDIDSLRALKIIAEQGGVTKAAHVLALSQSAVSHKIKRLEDSIDSVLLTRRVGAPLLTEAGERLLSYANRIVALHDEALAGLSKRTLAGSIRLGMTEDMTSSGLARILARFTRLFPAVAVRTHVSQSMVLQRQVRDNEIDLGVMQVFAYDRKPDDRLLFENRLCWVKARDFPLPVEGPIPFLAYDDNCIYKDWMLEETSMSGNSFSTTLQCSSNAGIIAAVEAGLGVTIVNEHHVSGSMDVLENDFPTPPGLCYVVRLSARSKSNAVRVLADEIASEAAQHNALKVA